MASRKTAPAASSLASWIRNSLEEEPPRSKSLIATIFGDAIAPHGSSLWLGDLIELLRPFGVSDRLVRTSVFRLAEEGWLEARRLGRRSRYSLTTTGALRFEHAFRRIYHPPGADWDGLWTLVMLPRADNAAPERAELRRELEWEGFGFLAPGIFIHPAADARTVAEILTRQGLTGRAMVLAARDVAGLAARPVADLALQCWDLDEVAGHYRRFLDRFAQIAGSIGPTSSLQPEEAFVARTLLIHSFRRVSLHDPHLPPAMLPADWPGHRAYELTSGLYRSIYRRSESHLRGYVVKPAGAERSPAPESLRRFGGLG